MTGFPLLKVKSDRLVPIDWDDYAYLISLGLNLSPKWIIARNLLELVRLHSNPSECPAFERLWEGVDQHGMVSHIRNTTSDGDLRGNPSNSSIE